MSNNLPMDVAVLKEAKQIQVRTKQLADTLRQQWQAGSRVRAELLPTQLNHYAAFIRRFYPYAPVLDSPPAILVSPIGWLEHLNLPTEPKLAALVALTQLETQVRQSEATALA